MVLNIVVDVLMVVATFTNFITNVARLLSNQYMLPITL